MTDATSAQAALETGGHQTGAAETRQFLTFKLGGEVYGIDIVHIREISEYASITKVPMMPAFISGVTNLRGNVVPVIDLAVRFNGAPVKPGKRTSVIIIELDMEDAPVQLGVIVDQVNEVLELTANELEPPPTFGARIRTDFISGMGRVDDTFLVMLDVEHVLSIDELSQIQGLGVNP